MKRAILTLLLGVAVVHCLILAFLPHPLLPSNVIQLVAALFAVAVCILRWRQAKGPYFRWLWQQLFWAFLIWSVAQGYYVWYLVVRHQPTPYPSIADFLWLSFSFPILLAASRPYDRTGKEQKKWTGYLDFAQACVSVLLLYGIIYVAPVGILDTVAYGIQALGLVLSSAIRFSTATVPEEHTFFWELTLYGIIYGVIAIGGTLWQDYGSPAGGVTDLAWSLPLLAFCAITYGFHGRIRRMRTRNSNILPPHIHGVSSLGLALISLAAGAILTVYRHGWGMAGMAVSCLLLVLRTAIREARLEQAQDQLQYAVLHDSLTGLPNRELLILELEKMRSSLSAEKFLLFLDLDRFKTINDSLGHKVGDNLLVHIGQVLQYSVRQENIVARLGGDEFVILLDSLEDGETIEGIAERILSAIRLPVQIDNRELYITASIGILPVTAEKSTIKLLRDADTAMYRAKALGKNRASMFDQSLIEKTVREMEMGTALRASIEARAISVAYQPVYSLKNSELKGFEALARWNHPLYGEVPAEEFIPLAEHTGLIAGLGRQVMRRACFETAAWNLQFHTRHSVSINVSGMELADPGFLLEMENILQESRLDPALLALEVTESVLLHDEDAAREVLGKAHDLGISIYLDDFGTGYSSLKYLLQFPFDAIKIDKGFVLNLEQDEKRAELLKAIVHLSRNLRKKTIAEGIETQAQMRFLTSIYCDFGQGFLFSRPLSSEGVACLLQSRTNDSTKQQAHLALKPECI
jgi:diguanylate cyclase (GGDEF)-like protein